jgi:hypothetical protein
MCVTNYRHLGFQRRVGNERNAGERGYVRLGKVRRVTCLSWTFGG